MLHFKHSLNNLNTYSYSKCSITALPEGRGARRGGRGSHHRHQRLRGDARGIPILHRAGEETGRPEAGASQPGDTGPGLRRRVSGSGDLGNLGAGRDGDRPLRLSDSRHHSDMRCRGPGD